mmetsp:Transcript_34206/g.86862  ORF Transcript_34206/g.86862 Transcript_34206/m.86862 type:complete len:249 (+) Transcript_34206:438-1184(+)
MGEAPPRLHDNVGLPAHHGDLRQFLLPLANVLLLGRDQGQRAQGAGAAQRPRHAPRHACGARRAGQLHARQPRAPRHRGRLGAPLPRPLLGGPRAPGARRRGPVSLRVPHGDRPGGAREARCADGAGARAAASPREPPAQRRARVDRHALRRRAPRRAAAGRRGAGEPLPRGGVQAARLVGLHRRRRRRAHAARVHPPGAAARRLPPLLRAVRALPEAGRAHGAALPRSRDLLPWVPTTIQVAARPLR